MNDVTLVADLIIAMCEGIQTKKQIKPVYAKYENDFPFDNRELENHFDQTIEIINAIFNNNFKATTFRRIHVFYSLFTSIYHSLFGVKNIKAEKIIIDPRNYPKVRNALEQIENLFEVEEIGLLDNDKMQFLNDCRRATTDTKVRIRRTEFIVNLINKVL